MVFVVKFMGRTKLVKLFQSEYDILVEAQKKLMKCGINSLPEELRKDVTDFDLGSIVKAGAQLLINQLQKEG